MLPLLEEQPSLSLMSGTEKTLSVWGPEPGSWYLVAGYTRPHNAQQTQDCHPMMSLMAEYLIETDIITVIPTFYNYQDIRTFYTVNTTQTFKARIKGEYTLSSRYSVGNIIIFLIPVSIMQFTEILISVLCADWSSEWSC